MGKLRLREVREFTQNYPDKNQLWPWAWFLFSDTTLGASYPCAESYTALHCQRAPSIPNFPASLLQTEEMQR